MRTKSASVLITERLQNARDKTLSMNHIHALHTREGGCVAEVTSSLALNQAEKQQLQRLVEKLMGDVVEYRYHVDATLLGGFRVSVADWIIDASLLSQIAKVSSLLKE